MSANTTRKDHIANMILAKKHKKCVEVVVYEPTLDADEFFHSRVIKDLAEFKAMSDVIVSNRYGSDLLDVKPKVYTRDLFGYD